MSNFNDLMKKPLPSASSREQAITESVDETMETPVEEETPVDGEEGAVTENEDPAEAAMDTASLDEDGDPIEVDPEVAAELEGLSDDDLDDLEKDINASDLGDDDVDEVKLSPEEEEEADDFMALAATNSLIQSEMNVSEKVAFAESAIDVQCALNEGLITEADVQEFLSLKEAIRDAELVTEAVYNGKTKVKMSLQDRIKQLFWVGVYSSARARKDPEYVKLQKVFELKRRYKNNLARKYRSEANQKVKVYIKRLKSSKSPVLSKLGEGLK